MKEVFIITLLFFIFLPSKVFAQTEYVLPYPSAMPGSKFYLIDQIKEKIFLYGYFGSFGQFTFHLKQADKYLVEAKTLFEYDQYLLASKALQKSDEYFKKTPDFLERAKQEGKNTAEQESVLQSAAVKHILVLEKLKKELPKEFIWRPEKKAPEVLQLHKLIENSVTIRSSSM